MSAAKRCLKLSIFLTYLLQAPVHAKQIKVTLFDQPCLLSGPFDVTTLTRVHSISPEKVPPHLSSEQARKMLNLLGPGSFPAVLEKYRESLKKRISAQLAFNDSLAAAQKKTNIEVFLTNIREHIAESRFKDFDVGVRRLSTKAGTHWGPAFADQLKEFYITMIEPDPEEEFHRAIRRANIHYACAFDEGGETATEEDQEATAAPPVSTP